MQIGTRARAAMCGFNIAIALALGNVVCDAAPPSEGKLSADEIAYREAIQQRSEKIVAKLNLDDSAMAERLTDIVAAQYRELRDIHDERDSAVAAATGTEADTIRLNSAQAVVGAHRAFVAKLGAELSAEQVDQVKDGMTYGVAPNTYRAYCDLLPSLSEEDQRFIMACLLEAREYAMDAGSSDEKHGWFGKYKGRINNYLSDRGYDLKQAERDRAERQLPAKEQLR